MPVIVFIEEECPDEVKGKLYAGIKDIEAYGTKLLYMRPGLIKPLGDKLFELRVYEADKWYRVIHAYVGNNVVVFLNAFIKKRNNIDPEDIKESQKRLRKYLENG
jgi:phage-related protein